MCDGDARIALNSLQLAMQSILESADCPTDHRLKRVTLEAIKDGIKVSTVARIDGQRFIGNLIIVEIAFAVRSQR